MDSIEYVRIARGNLIAMVFMLGFLSATTIIFLMIDVKLSQTLGVGN